MRKRPVLFATIAVVVLGAAGATAVFLVGSKQRRDDRAAYLAYERAILGPIAETRRIGIDMRALVGRSALDHFSFWRESFTTTRAAILNADPPAFMRDARARWRVAVEAYAGVAELLVGESPPNASLAALTKADDLFDDAAQIMQFHRRRLGLGATAQLPDPAATHD